LLFIQIDIHIKILNLYRQEDMAIREDAENPVQEAEIREPLIRDDKTLADGEDGSSQKSSEGHPWMVYFSTFVAVCGSYEFGACVSAFSVFWLSSQALYKCLVFL
jgi:hypothetical protein